MKNIEDREIWEVSQRRIRFRKFPWTFWIMGSLWLFGALYVIYEIYEELVVFHHRKIYGEYLLLTFLIVMGLIFLHKGKIRSVIFDRGEGTLTVKKRYFDIID